MDISVDGCRIYLVGAVSFKYPEMPISLPTGKSIPNDLDHAVMAARSFPSELVFSRK